MGLCDWPRSRAAPSWSIWVLSWDLVGVASVVVNHGEVGSSVVVVEEDWSVVRTMLVEALGWRNDVAGETRARMASIAGAKL